MTPQTPDWQTMVERLEGVERENRRLKARGVVALIGLAAVLLMGQAVPGRRDIEAQSFTLLDSTGKSQARLGMVAGGPALQLFDADGHGRAGISVRQDGTPWLSLFDGSGKGGVTLAVGANQDTVLLIRDPDGKARATLGLGGQGVSLVLADAQGVSRVGIDVQAGDATRVVLQDRAGTTRAALGIDQTGAPTLRVIGRTGQPSAVLMSNDLGATLTLYDSSGAPRALVGPVEGKDQRAGTVMRRPASSVVLLNPDGKVIWQAP
jgi:hypothetical protein